MEHTVNSPLNQGDQFVSTANPVKAVTAPKNNAKDEDISRLSGLSVESFAKDMKDMYSSGDTAGAGKTMSEDGKEIIVDSKHFTHVEKGEDILAKMYSWDFIGLYAHYAAIGIQGGIGGICYNFCAYSFAGSANVCANSANIIYLPWSFKVFFAMVTDSYRPFNLRRKSYMVGGWIGVLLTTLLLAILGTNVDAGVWIAFNMLTMFFLMIADVPADGYCVELGKFESDTQRGQVLATGQRIRFICSIFAGLIQAFMVNGPNTNPAGCPIDANNCWGWGFTVGQYYGFIFCILFVLFLPILRMKELDGKHIPLRTFKEHAHELWETLKNRTTLFLLIFVAGSGLFSTMTNITTVYIQYYVIGISNFQSGIAYAVTGLAVVAGVKIFQTYFINKNWRITQYLSSIFNAILGLLWLLVFWNVGGLLNPWFTIFINLGQQFALGITQVLFAMAVIELAKFGQEAVTYELIISTANAASTISSIVGTQLLSPGKANLCDNTGSDDITCTDDQVPTANFLDHTGPSRFTNYTLMILGINIVATLIFTQFLPRQKWECKKWKEDGEKAGSPSWVGILGVFIASFIILYGIVTIFLLLNPDTSCLPAVGGAGC